MISARGKRSVKMEDSSPGKKIKRRHLSESDDESGKDVWVLKPTADFPTSSIYNCTSRSQPAELFRKDLISAMKLPDSEPLSNEDYWQISDQWKQEWEKGVQVPVNPEALPHPVVRVLRKKDKTKDYKIPKKYVRTTHDEFFSNDIHVMSNAPSQAEKMCRYDLDANDVHWLQIFNEERNSLGLQPVEELVMEMLIEELETQSHENIQHAIHTEAGLGIEYDEDVICDVCRSPDSEEGNEMVFCDSCDICVHQACYGITTIPEGSWVCRTCALGMKPNCLLCPNKGGAMKSTRNGQKWAHVSCALWIPEVIIGCVEVMEPITKISHIPPSRWALVCCLCREKVGACIQCSVKKCKTAYHVTCAFQNGLDMKTIVEDEGEEEGVKFRSYCPKHSKNQEDTFSSDSDICETRKRKSKKKKKLKTVNEMKREEKSNQRAMRLQQIESEFYNYVNMKEVIQNLCVDKEVANFIFNYWKLKRRSSFNKPLMSPKTQETHALESEQDDSLYARMRMFVHLRQDLERVRNLCYMVSRREKLFLSWCKLREEIFEKQMTLLSDNRNSFSETEREKIIHAAHGKNIYDLFYSWDPTCCARGKKSPTKNQRKDSSETNKSTQKAQSHAKLPNPYAKTYFNGRSQRRSLLSSDAETNVVSKSDNETLAECNRTLSVSNQNVPVEDTNKLKSGEVDQSASESCGGMSKSNNKTTLVCNNNNGHYNDLHTSDSIKNETSEGCENKNIETPSKDIISKSRNRQLRICSSSSSSSSSSRKITDINNVNCVDSSSNENDDSLEHLSSTEKKKLSPSDKSEGASESCKEIYDKNSKLKNKENSNERKDDSCSKRKDSLQTHEEDRCIKNRKRKASRSMASKKLFQENSGFDADDDEDSVSSPVKVDSKKQESAQNNISDKESEVGKGYKLKSCSPNAANKAISLQNKRIQRSPSVHSPSDREEIKDDVGTDIDGIEKPDKRVREIDKRNNCNVKDKLAEKCLKRVSDSSKSPHKDANKNNSSFLCSKIAKEISNVQKRESLQSKGEKERLQTESKDKVQKAEVREPPFSQRSSSKSSLSGYRIPKKQKPASEEKPLNGSVTETKKANGSVLNSLSIHSVHSQTKESKTSCELFNPLSSPDDGIHHQVEIVDQENNRSPRIVIKLRKDPNYPESTRWQRDGDNLIQEIVSSESPCHVSKSENLWQGTENYHQQRLRREPSKYSMRSRTNTQDFYSQYGHSEPS